MNEFTYHIHKEGKRHQDCDAKCELLTRIWRSLETKDHHAVILESNKVVLINFKYLAIITQGMIRLLK